MVYVAPLLYSTVLIVTYIYRYYPEIAPTISRENVSMYYIIPICCYYIPYVYYKYHKHILFLYIPISHCITLSLSLSVCLPACLYLSIYLSISVYRSIDLSVCMFLYIPTCSPLSTHQTTVFFELPSVPTHRRAEISPVSGPFLTRVS